MKILMVVRLYSHMVRSVVEDRWVPEGMPAFYKLVEGLDESGIKTDVVFMCKDIHYGISRVLYRTFESLPNVQFHVVPWRRRPMNRIDVIRNEWYQFKFIRRLMTRCRYSLLFCDRVHAHFMALFAYGGRKVVVRLYGVAQLPTALESEKRGWFPPIGNWSFRAPFAGVWCSKDGSPGRHFMSRYMRNDVPTQWMLNGVDPPSLSAKQTVPDLREHHGLPPNAPVILTTGNMAPDKSSDCFVDAAIALGKQNAEFLVVNVGDGILRESLEREVMRHNLSHRIVFVGRVPHVTVYEYLEQADIYVSLNQYGNLSNAVLEAMNAGKCIVTFKMCTHSLRDEQNADKELNDALVLIDRDEMGAQLKDALVSLLKHPEIIREKSEKITRYARSNLQSWDGRISKEIDWLQACVR